MTPRDEARKAKFSRHSGGLLLACLERYDKVGRHWRRATLVSVFFLQCLACGAPAETPDANQSESNETAAAAPTLVQIETSLLDDRHIDGIIRGASHDIVLSGSKIALG